MKVTALIPVYNEEKTITGVLQVLKEDPWLMKYWLLTMAQRIIVLPWPEVWGSRLSAWKNQERVLPWNVVLNT